MVNTAVLTAIFAVFAVLVVVNVAASPLQYSLNQDSKQDLGLSQPVSDLENSSPIPRESPLQQSLNQDSKQDLGLSQPVSDLENSSPIQRGPEPKLPDDEDVESSLTNDRAEYFHQRPIPEEVLEHTNLESAPVRAAPQYRSLNTGPLSQKNLADAEPDDFSYTKNRAEHFHQLSDPDFVQLQHTNVDPTEAKRTVKGYPPQLPLNQNSKQHVDLFDKLSGKVQETPDDGGEDR